MSSLRYLKDMDAAVLAVFRKNPQRWLARRHLLDCLPYTGYQITTCLNRLLKQGQLKREKQRWAFPHAQRAKASQCIGLNIDKEDLAWMAYWRQHRAERLKRQTAVEKAISKVINIP